MKLLQLIFLFLIFMLAPLLTQGQFARFSFMTSRPVIWTWVAGTLGPTNPAGNYGTKGVPSTSNIPQARSTGCTAKDNSGNIWFFGGHNRTNGAYTKNDLWRFNPSTLEWTWISGSNGEGEAGVFGTKGVPSTSNYPPGIHDASCFFDDTGYFWVFAGMDSGSTNYNTLWRFNPSTLEWTWMTGSNTTNVVGVYGTKGVPNAANTPSARERAGGWKGPGNTLWIYGGYDNQAGGRKSDMWRYDVATNTWTWMAGPSTTLEAVNYGVRGVESATNTPGARRVYQNNVDVDSSGNLWLFGGDSGGSSITSFGDLWRFNTSTLQWTWIAGSSTYGETGTYGGLHVPNANNKPPGRRVHVFFIKDNLFHVFGGYGPLQDHNDFWTYYPIADAWAWRGGVATGNAATVGGTIGVPAITNMPGARDGMNVMLDNNGKLWMFGGETGASAKSFNELWSAVVY